MNFYVNEIVKEQSTERNYRILWIDPDNIILYMLDLNNDKAFPEKKLVLELREVMLD